MKKFIFMSILFLGLSLQSFASTAIERTDLNEHSREYLKTESNNVSEVVSPKREIKDASTERLNTAMSQNEEELFGCSIVQVGCGSCGSYSTQYCDGGFHGNTIIDWAIQVCEWACR